MIAWVILQSTELIPSSAVQWALSFTLFFYRQVISVSLIPIRMKLFPPPIRILYLIILLVSASDKQ